VPVHEKSIAIRGAFISGDIDLEGCEITQSLKLVSCRIHGSLVGAGTRLGGIDLEGSILNSVDCSYSRFEGSVRLNGGFEAEGAVSFGDAEIGGRLNCTGGKFKNANGDALSCGSAKVGGDVLLDDGFEAEGAVSISNAKIKGDLICADCTFSNQRGFDRKELKVTADALSLSGGLASSFLSRISRRIYCDRRSRMSLR